MVLTLSDYETHRSSLSPDPNLLAGLTEDELRALADGMLEAGHRERLAELLKRNREGELGKEENAELNRLIAGVDTMNILKARAMYTLRKME